MAVLGNLKRFGLSTPGRPFEFIKTMEDEILENLKFIGYARKSSEDNKERQAASLPDQVYIMEGIKARYDL